MLIPSTNQSVDLATGDPHIFKNMVVHGMKGMPSLGAFDRSSNVSSKK